jgi:hypothetical protein
MSKITQFCVVPFEKSKSIVLPENIHDLIDLSAETLAEMIVDEGQNLYQGRDYQFENIRLNLNEEYFSLHVLTAAVAQSNDEW